MCVVCLFLKKHWLLVYVCVSVEDGGEGQTHVINNGHLSG